MFERFAHRATQVVALAQEEACILKHDYIGPEHILLGLVREEDGSSRSAQQATTWCRSSTTRRC